jgi:hypothetical protein
MGSVVWRLVPDVEAAFRRFPATVLFVFVASGLLFAFGDTDIFTFARGAGGVAPTAPVLFVGSLAAIFASYAFERVGATRGWKPGVGVALAVATAVVLVALQQLPRLAPALSALWLPIDLDRVATGTGLLALAASAGSAIGTEANRRVLATLVTVLAAVFVPWLTMTALSGAFIGGQLTPVAQCIVFVAASLLALSWLAITVEGDGLLPGIGARAEVLRRLVLPVVLVLLLAIAGNIARRLGQGDIPTMQDVPQIVGPAAAILMLITGTYLYFAQSAKVGKPDALSTGFVNVVPWLMAAVAATVVWGLGRECAAAQAAMPNLPPMARPLGAIHISDTLGRWLFGAVALVMALLAVIMPRRRDLRLPLTIGGMAMILSGVGPLSLDRLASLRFAAEFERALATSAARTQAGVSPAERIVWTQEGRLIVDQTITWLARSEALGALEPAFRGSVDNPFEAPGISPQTLQAALLARLNISPARPPVAPLGEPPAKVRQLQLVTNRQSPQIAMPLAGFDTLAGPINLNTWVAQAHAPIRLDFLPTSNAPMPPTLTAHVTADATVTLKNARGAVIRFDLRPLINVLLERDDQRRLYLERQRNVAHSLPRDSPLPPLAEPQTIEALDGVKARLIVERLTGREVDGTVTITDALSWLLADSSVLEPKP